MTPTAARTDRSRWIALVVLCAGMLMIILDQTIVNVALPHDPERPRASRSRAWHGSSTPT